MTYFHKSFLLKVFIILSHYFLVTGVAQSYFSHTQYFNCSLSRTLLTTQQHLDECGHPPDSDRVQCRKIMDGWVLKALGYWPKTKFARNKRNMYFTYCSICCGFLIIRDFVRRWNNFQHDESIRFIAIFSVVFLSDCFHIYNESDRTCQYVSCAVRWIHFVYLHRSSIIRVLCIMLCLLELGPCENKMWTSLCLDVLFSSVIVHTWKH